MKKTMFAYDKSNVPTDVADDSCVVRCGASSEEIIGGGAAVVASSGIIAADGSDIRLVSRERNDV